MVKREPVESKTPLNSFWIGNETRNDCFSFEAPSVVVVVPVSKLPFVFSYSFDDRLLSSSIRFASFSLSGLTTGLRIELFEFFAFGGIFVTRL